MANTEVGELRAFQSVVKHQSYARAARELNLTPSGVSRLMSRLEHRLGVSLLKRTTRRVTLTSVGAAFHGRTYHLLAELEHAESAAREATAVPQGLLRISAPVPFGQTYLTPLLSALLERYPLLQVDLALKDSTTDLIAEGIDLVVRIGILRESRLVARRLCTNRRVLVASPEYVERHGAPQRPKDLSHHNCLSVTYLTSPGQWKLFGPGGPVNVAIDGALSSNNVEVLIAAAEQGLGISVGPTQSVAPALLDGRLVRVLSDYELERTAIYALYPSRRQLPSKVRAAVDFLSEHFVDPPQWDIELCSRVSGFAGEPDARGER